MHSKPSPCIFLLFKMIWYQNQPSFETHRDVEINKVMGPLCHRIWQSLPREFADDSSMEINVKGQFGWGFEQPSLAGGISACGRGVGVRWSLRPLPTKNIFIILWFYDPQETYGPLQQLLAARLLASTDSPEAVASVGHWTEPRPFPLSHFCFCKCLTTLSEYPNCCAWLSSFSRGKSSPAPDFPAQDQNKNFSSYNLCWELTYFCQFRYHQYIHWRNIKLEVKEDIKTMYIPKLCTYYVCTIIHICTMYISIIFKTHLL